MKSLPPETYRRICPEVFNSTIGGHIRHNLDHYQALMRGEEKGEVDYDNREREARVETDPALAVAEMEKLRDRLEGLAGADLDRPLRVRMDDGGGSAWSRTTLRRELQFLLSHSIHHYALVVSIATRFGITRFPEGFGVAPSTIHYRAQAGS
ncbi:MAG: DinB family protein [Oceanipulchritudo sp.]